MQGSSKSVSTTPVTSFDKSGKFYAAPSPDSYQRQASPDSYHRHARRQDDEEQDSLAYSVSPSGSGANQGHYLPFKTSSRRAMTDSPPPPPPEPLRRLVASCWSARGGGSPGDGTDATATVNWGEITQGAPSSGPYNYGEHYDVEDVGDGRLAAGEFSIMAEKICSALEANPKRETVPKTAVPPPASPIIFTNTKATTTGDYNMPTNVAAEDQHRVVNRDVGTTFPSLLDSQGPTIPHHTEPRDQLFEMVKAAALQQQPPVKNVCDTSMEEEDDEIVGMNDTYEATAATKTTYGGGSLTPLTASITPSPDIVRMQISPKKTPVNDDFMQISPKKTPPSSGKNFFRTGVPTGLRTIAERAFPRSLEASSSNFPHAPAIPMEEFEDNIDAGASSSSSNLPLPPAGRKSSWSAAGSSKSRGGGEPFSLRPRGGIFGTASRSQQRQDPPGKTGQMVRSSSSGSSCSSSSGAGGDDVVPPEPYEELHSATSPIDHPLFYSGQHASAFAPGYVESNSRSSVAPSQQASSSDNSKSKHQKPHSKAFDF